MTSCHPPALAAPRRAPAVARDVGQEGAAPNGDRRDVLRAARQAARPSSARGLGRGLGCSVLSPARGLGCSVLTALAMQ